LQNRVLRGAGDSQKNVQKKERDKRRPAGGGSVKKGRGGGAHCGARERGHAKNRLKEYLLGGGQKVERPWRKM